MACSSYPAVGGAFEAKVIHAYGRIAHRYEAAHRRWLRHSGRSAQDAFDGATAAIVQPGFRLLDAGCGPARVASRLIRLCNGHLDAVLLDACPEMLDRASTVSSHRHLGTLDAMPFPAKSFDLVTCAWALETTLHPLAALHDLVRVTRPGGVVCFVSVADLGQSRKFQRMIQGTINRRNLGRPLRRIELDEVPGLFPSDRVQILNVGTDAVMGLIRKGPGRQPSG